MSSPGYGLRHDRKPVKSLVLSTPLFADLADERVPEAVADRGAGVTQNRQVVVT